MCEAGSNWGDQCGVGIKRGEHVLAVRAIIVSPCSVCAASITREMPRDAQRFEDIQSTLSNVPKDYKKIVKEASARDKRLSAALREQQELEEMCLVFAKKAESCMKKMKV